MMQANSKVLRLDFQTQYYTNAGARYTVLTTLCAAGHGRA